jgi:uncharacterized lipoprotein YmbA
MTRIRLGSILVLVALAGGLGGCLSLKRTPEARFFVLRPLVEATPSPSPGAVSGLVGVLTVILPEHLDRAQVVTWKAPDELRIDEFTRWAEPLDVGVTRVLAEDLAALLPDRAVLRYPWPEHAGLRCRVRLELSLFGAQSGGEVRLEGRWELLPEHGERPLVLRPVSLRREPAVGAAQGPDTDAEVDAMSQLVADLSRQSAAAIVELPAEPEG